MTADSDTADDGRVEQTNRKITGRALVTVAVISLLATEPVLAQTNPVCQAGGLADIISGFFRVTTSVGLIGAVAVWQGDSLVEMFTVSPDQRERLKRHKRVALKSVVILLGLGPLYTVAGSMMGLPLAECVDLVPW